MTTGSLNHYQALMLDPEVDADVISTVYRRLVQRYRSATTDDASASERLLSIEGAYEILREPRRRALYDAALVREGESEDSDLAREGEGEDSAVPLVTPVASPVVTQGARQTASTPQTASARQTGAVSVLDFGRYAGWSLRQLAAHDPNYLEWLLRSPGGRQYHAEITAILQPR